ncbi:MAG TPA: ABC transporter substrate-binding protein [Stellaceae bacterium]|nr:ABC transporter substrate-binding protein [Stellaceae bacterium]
MWCWAALAALMGTGAALAEPIKIGVVGVNAFAPVYVAQERGYFAAEGVPAELVYFDAAAPVAVATVAGAIDFGVAAVTAAFYNLAGQGELKLVAAAAHEAPGFQIQAFLASRHAWDAGLKSLKDLGGHSFGVTTKGAPPVYVVGAILAEKYGFDFKTIEVLSLQSIPNINTALTGGKADFTTVSMTPGMQALIDRGDIKRLAWVGDEAPWQFGIVFAGAKTAAERHDTVDRFLRAYRKGARDYHDATTGADGKRKDGPAAEAMIAILAKYTKQSVEEVKYGIPYLDADARLDVKDIMRQVAFYKAQGLVKGEADAAAMIDQRSVIPLAAK